MPVVKSIRNRNKFLIPAVISSFVTANQQNSASARVKRKEHAIRPSRMLNPKFFHVRMTRRMNEIGMRTRKARAEFLEKDDFGVTSTCSASVSPSHQMENSSVNSTSHSTDRI